MRQKKSKKFLYILAGVAVLGILFAATREMPIKTEHVEQPLENSFLK